MVGEAVGVRKQRVMRNPHFPPNLVVDLKLHLKSLFLGKKKITQAQEKNVQLGIYIFQVLSTETKIGILL